MTWRCVAGPKDLKSPTSNPLLNRRAAIKPTNIQVAIPDFTAVVSQHQTPAEIATKAKPRLLILYHQLFWGTTEDELLNEIRQGYQGKVVSGRDLDVY